MYPGLGGSPCHAFWNLPCSCSTEQLLSPQRLSRVFCSHSSQDPSLCFCPFLSSLFISHLVSFVGSCSCTSTYSIKERTWTCTRPHLSDLIMPDKPSHTLHSPDTCYSSIPTKKSASTKTFSFNHPFLPDMYFRTTPFLETFRSSLKTTDMWVQVTWLRYNSDSSPKSDAFWHNLKIFKKDFDLNLKDFPRQ